MSFTSHTSRALAAMAILAAPASASLAAQPAETQAEEVTVYGDRLIEGPEIRGVITARKDNRLQVTSEDGTQTVITIDESTEIKASGGFLGLSRDALSHDALLNGLPVTVETQQWEGRLLASRIDLKGKDLKTARMIQQGTAQGFAEQTAATEALRGRMGDIDKYNVKGTTNVYFDTGEATLSSRAQAELCGAAAQADATDNALLLVVGYTDSTGDYEFNQQLSEKRASRVVNYLQQACGWKPYRMLTPTGMAEADPAASNETEAGKAQNRRVAVNILVSKSVDGL